jgi:hypothetical protein
MGQAHKSWSTWVAEKGKAGIKITDEIDTKMAPFITALKQSRPDLETNQILDMAYKHATIDDIEKMVQGQVLKSADQAKKGTIPRITPKGTAKADSDKSYAEIIREYA